MGAGDDGADQGRPRPAADLDLLLEIADTIGIIPGTTICGLADGAAWPIKNAIRKFRGEFEEYLQRTNPGGYLLTTRAGHGAGGDAALRTRNEHLFPLRDAQRRSKLGILRGYGTQERVPQS